MILASTSSEVRRQSNWNRIALPVNSDLAERFVVKQVLSHDPERLLDSCAIQRGAADHILYLRMSHISRPRAH
jgi:hypothetical protein